MFRKLYLFREAKFFSATYVSGAAKLGHIYLRKKMFPSLDRSLYIVASIMILVNCLVIKWLGGLGGSHYNKKTASAQSLNVFEFSCGL